MSNQHLLLETHNQAVNRKQAQATDPAASNITVVHKMGRTGHTDLHALTQRCQMHS
jgi:hypothetical protein